MTSTTAARPARRELPGRVARPLLVVTTWLVAWQLAAIVVGQDLLLVSPAEVLTRLTELVVTGAFWATIGHSAGRIAGGFLTAVVVGCLTAALAAASRVADALLTSLATAIRSTPVVSFIILVLIWADSGQLAFLISFMMVAPIVHTNVLEGFRHRDTALLEVATVFEVPVLRRLPAIDAPAVLPHLLAACQVGVGLAWKSGITAEVIGLPQGSIGERLYQAKIFLSTADLFAWTIVIIALSFLFERVVRALLTRLEVRVGRVGS
jgi:NitT/TauT family transport system permease protein